MEAAGLCNNEVNITEAPVNVSQLPLVTNENGEKVSMLKIPNLVCINFVIMSKTYYFSEFLFLILWIIQ